MVKRPFRSAQTFPSNNRLSALSALPLAPVCHVRPEAGGQAPDQRNFAAQDARNTHPAPEAPTRSKGTVLVLDDDPRIRNNLAGWLGTQGFTVQAYATVPDFFQSVRAEGPACLLLDLQLGNTDGFEVLNALKLLENPMPAIVLTGRGDAATVVKAMRHGACDFLTKPHNPDELLAAIRDALELSRHQQGLPEEAMIRRRAATLTARERTVLSLVLGGMLNKQVADALGLALVTVKLHRGRAMRKLAIRTAAELGRIADVAGLQSGVNTPIAS